MYTTTSLNATNWGNCKNWALPKKCCFWIEMHSIYSNKLLFEWLNTSGMRVKVFAVQGFPSIVFKKNLFSIYDISKIIFDIFWWGDRLRFKNQRILVVFTPKKTFPLIRFDSPFPANLYNLQAHGLYNAW